MVPRERIELSHCLQYRILSPARLPVPPSRHINEWQIIARVIVMRKQFDGDLLKFDLTLQKYILLICFMI